MRSILFGLLLGLGACSWSSFDDLGGETWVDSTGGAEGVDPHDFIGIAAPGVSASNAAFVVLGRSDDSIGSYSFDADGVRASSGIDFATTSIEFGPLPPDAVIAGDPYSNFIGVASTTNIAGDGDTKVAHFSADDPQGPFIQNDFNNTGVFDGPILPTGMVYAQTDDDSADPTATDAVLARGPQIAMLPDYSASASAPVACLGATSDDLVLSVARGQFEADTGVEDDELVASINDVIGTAPQIVIFNGRAITKTWEGNMTAVTACFDDGDLTGDRKPLARINGHAGDKDFGRHLVVGDFDNDGDADLAVSATESTVVAFINDGNTPPAFTEVDVPAPPTAPGFGSALAVGDLDGQPGDELVVGAPQATFGDAEHAGLAAVYTFDGTDFIRAFEVHDAQPEVEQRFGTGVAVVPWQNGDHNVLVVVADHEIFTYFETQLYDDVR
jgi:hypothetical protein